ncbi:MAG: DUF4091 domain-containing protein [Oscillospiraceae bacterium]
MKNFKIKNVSSLEKIFWDSEEHFFELSADNCFAGEIYSYQIAFFADIPNNDRQFAEISIDSPLLDLISVKEVAQVPCAFPSYENADNYLRTAPGFYPDCLKELKNNGLFFVAGRWNSLWISIRTDGIPEGSYSIKTTLSYNDVNLVSCFTLNVAAAALPALKIPITQWLHNDCIAQYHHAEIWSEPFFEILENYIKKAVEYGINTLFTPLFTPALDTLVGQERLTCQLVRITRCDKLYSFDFSLLDRWIELGRKSNIKYFEFSHLLTQWGAKSAPKILAFVDGVETKIFGWETRGDSEEYLEFLKQFSSALYSYIMENALNECCFIHISDEPNEKDCRQYQIVSQIISQYMPRIPIIDAISSYSLYKSGVITHPVVAINHLKPFLDNHVPNLMTYYCCAQSVSVPNRFIAQPSTRNRIFGILCYKYALNGFLQWGYNFYNSRFSINPIDPYAVTDAEFSFPSGDPFSVYPTEKGCTESLRLVVFNEGLQDYRALCLLEAKCGREYALRFLTNTKRELSFDNYPQDISFFHEFKQSILKLICGDYPQN